MTSKPRTDAKQYQNPLLPPEPQEEQEDPDEHEEPDEHDEQEEQEEQDEHEEEDRTGSGIFDLYCDFSVLLSVLTLTLSFRFLSIVRPVGRAWILLRWMYRKDTSRLMPAAVSRAHTQRMTENVRTPRCASPMLLKDCTAHSAKSPSEA